MNRFSTHTHTHITQDLLIVCKQQETEIETFVLLLPTESKRALWLCSFLAREIDWVSNELKTVVRSQWTFVFFFYFFFFLKWAFVWRVICSHRSIHLEWCAFDQLKRGIHRCGADACLLSSPSFSFCGNAVNIVHLIIIITLLFQNFFLLPRPYCPNHLEQQEVNR
jgi:hypothetical protein